LPEAPMWSIVVDHEGLASVGLLRYETCRGRSKDSGVLC